MKTRDLTLKQQIRVRAKVFRILKSIGFQQAESTNGAYWWRKAGHENHNQRVCVGFDVRDQCLGGRTGWTWQIAALDKEPLFGYSGTTHSGAAWGTVKHVIDITLDKIHDAGSRSYHAIATERIAKAKQIVNGALAAL